MMSNDEILLAKYVYELIECNLNVFNTEYE